jgi:hypothetical protein
VSYPKITVYDASTKNAGFVLQNTTTGQTSNDGLFVGLGVGGSGDAETAYIYHREAGPLVFATSNTEAARIDSSGNLLVGKTATTFGTTGITIGGKNGAHITRSGGVNLSLNRLQNGEVLGFYNNSSVSGLLGVSSNNIYLGSDDTGLYFNNGTNTIHSYNVTTQAGSATDGTVSLGQDTIRFKDLYLSGGIEIENGTANVGVGKQALGSNTGSYNTALGYQSGYSNTSGVNNTFVGVQAGYSNQTGQGLTFVGRNAGYSSTGSNNTMVGISAGYNSTGGGNTFMGRSHADAGAWGSGQTMTTGQKNTLIGGHNGDDSYLDIRTEDQNVLLSDGMGVPVLFRQGDFSETRTYHPYNAVDGGFVTDRVTHDIQLHINLQGLSTSSYTGIQIELDKNGSAIDGWYDLEFGIYNGTGAAKVQRLMGFFWSTTNYTATRTDIASAGSSFSSIDFVKDMNGYNPRFRFAYSTTQFLYGRLSVRGAINFIQNQDNTTLLDFSRY